MNKFLLLALARSVAIVLFISLSIGCGVGYITGSVGKGIVASLIVIVLQYALSSIVVGISERKNTEAEFLAEQVLKEASERRLPYNLNCAYCNTTNKAGVSFTRENIFDCASCKQPNKVYVQFSTVRMTTPLTQKEKAGEFIGMEDEEEDTTARQTTVNESISTS
jgi:hypothetical protein